MEKTYEGIEQKEEIVKKEYPRSLKCLIVLAEVLALGSVILVGVWTGYYRGGFGWQEDLAKEFNYHPFFMVIGFIFLPSNSILVYRIFRHDNKKYIKALHALLNGSSLIIVSVGLKAVFDTHNLKDPPIPNLYSLHSWIGLATAVLFGLQFLLSFLAFLFPGFPTNVRRCILPLHKYMGSALFIMSIGSCLSGLTEKALFTIMATYSKFIAETYIINMTAVFLVSTGLVVMYIVTNDNYKRDPPPEDADEYNPMLQTTQHD